MSRKGYETLATNEDNTNQSFHPTKSANLLSLLTFWWMNNIFSKGNKRPLNQSDFLPLHEDDKARDLTERLQKEWNDQLLKWNNSQGKQPRLWRCVLRTLVSKVTLFHLSVWVFESFFRITQPLLIGFLLSMLSSNEINLSLVYACCWLLASIGFCYFGKQYSVYNLELLGMRTSSALKGIIYLKIPLVSRQDLLETTTGNIFDLISNDVQRIEQAPVPFTSLLFKTPLELIAVVCLLLYLIGWQPLMGVLFILMLIPVCMIISYFCAKLRKKTAKVTDRRISQMSEVVCGIRALKAHAWEENYKEKVQEVRRNEIWMLTKKSFLLSIIGSFLFASSAATFLSMLALVLTGEYRSPSRAFMILAFMKTLRSVSLRLADGAPLAFELFVSFQRIERFLLLNNVALDPLDYDDGASNQLLIRKSCPKDRCINQKVSLHDGDAGDEQSLASKLRDGSLSVSNLTCKSGDKYLLRDVSFDSSRRSLTVITGQVGSGKSTLLAAIAGEAAKTRGSVLFPGNVSYVPQRAWLFSGTFRENILFGEPYDKEKYAEVIDACALREDVGRFPNGDLTFVGEQGVTLSGGQRARVSLARAVYADADVYLLDDPLSAVDAKVGEHIFNQCICKLLQNKITILVSYGKTHMIAADQVVVLHEGSLLGKGSFNELQGREEIAAVIDASVNEEKPTPPTLGTEDGIAHSRFEKSTGSFDEHLEIEEEEKAIGKISATMYWEYFKAGTHPAVVIFILSFFVGAQALIVSPDLWLSHLTKMSWGAQQESETWYIYASFVSAALIVAAIRVFLFFFMCLRSAENLHNKMVSSLLQAKVLFFDTNPAGRILNRFSKDIGCLDELLPALFAASMQLNLSMLTAAVLPAFTNVWLSFVCFPVIGIFLCLAWYYLKTSRELKRWQSICRSPVFSHFSETIAGLDTIRTRKRERDFIDQFYRRQDVHNQVFSMTLSSNRWLCVRVDILSSFLIAAVATLSVLVTEEPALIGLSLAYVIETTNVASYAVRKFSDVENFMTSFERVKVYTNLDAEPGYKIESMPPMNWPRDGHVSFTNVSLRYYPGGPQVLKDLTFNIKGRQNLGIVGRTGDGKSSIVAALLRMPEAEGGIFIDDVSVNSVQLQESRRCISVLSQSPVLFSGSLKTNLDPLNKHSDNELWSVLKEVKLNRLVEDLEGQLDFKLLERGENLSVGERQLICLARTLLQQSKIVILDEPTAHVDPNTERTIWATVKEKLKNSTIITITHRLNTVKDCDLILVLREGQVAEIDTFNALMGQQRGIFQSLAASQGLLS